jgi:hypothetical protein
MLIGFTTLAKHLPNRPELKTVRSNDKVELKLDIGEIKLLNDVDLKKAIDENLFDQLNELEKNTACKITINGFYVEEYGNRTISLVITGTTLTVAIISFADCHCWCATFWANISLSINITVLRSTSTVNTNIISFFW